MLRPTLTILCLALVAGCTEGLSGAKMTQVNGFAHKVEQINGDPPTYKAYGALKKDRVKPTSAYFSRNVIAIRQVSGCPIKPELISHDRAAAQSVATVVC